MVGRKCQRKDVPHFIIFPIYYYCSLILISTTNAGAWYELVLGLNHSNSKPLFKYYFFGKALSFISRSLRPLLPQSFQPTPFTVVYAKVAGSKAEPNQVLATAGPAAFAKAGATNGSNQAVFDPTYEA